MLLRPASPESARKPFKRPLVIVTRFGWVAEMVRFVLLASSLLISSISDAPKADIRVRISLAVDDSSSPRVRVQGRTNLPPGTRVTVGVNDVSGYGFHDWVECLVDEKGTFASEYFGGSHGLPEGEYIASASLMEPLIQPESVRAIIGKSGEKLEGSLVIRGENALDVEQNKPFAIGEHPRAATYHRLRKVRIAEFEQRSQLRSLLAELLSFKENDDFKRVGFGIGGPYHEWLERLKSLESTSTKSGNVKDIDLRTAPTFLHLIGKDFIRTPASKFITDKLPEIKETLRFEQSKYWQQQEDRAETAARRWRDTTGTFSVVGKFVDVQDGILRIAKNDTKVIAVPIEKLSDSDIDHLISLLPN